MDFEGIAAWYDDAAAALAAVHGEAYGPMHPALRLEAFAASPRRQRFGAEELAAAEIERLGAGRVLELGCGFAAGLLYLSNIFPDVVFSGMCASETEIEFNRSLIRENDKIKSVLAFKGDYEDPKNYRVFPAVDLAFAVDALRHVRSLPALFANLAAVTKPGGAVLVIDAFAGPAAGKRLAAFAKATRVGALPTVQELAAAAAAAGFSLGDESDLGPAARRPVLRRLLSVGRRPWGWANPAWGAALDAAWALEGAVAKGEAVYRKLLFAKA